MKVLISFLLVMGLLPRVFAQQPLSPPSRVESPKPERVEYDMRQLISKPSLSETEMAGKRLVAQRCSLCHFVQLSTEKARAPELTAQTLTRLGEDGVRQQIMAGSSSMPAWKYTLQPADVDKIIAYLKTVKTARKPATNGTSPMGTPDGYTGEQ